MTSVPLLGCALDCQGEQGLQSLLLVGLQKNTHEPPDCRTEVQGEPKLGDYFKMEVSPELIVARA